MNAGFVKVALLCATSVTLSSPLLAVDAHAQAAAAGTEAQPADASANSPAEIIVTANKREERLNKVGSTITALSGDAIRSRGINTIQDIAAAVPGLEFAHSSTNTPILTLRGVGYNDSSLGVYPAVSVYIDQVPLPFPVLASHSSYDLQQIEVLKGPQGTLFGENSTGGAINNIAAKPVDHFETGGNLSFGRFSDIHANAYINVPLSTTLRARVAVDGENSDGWQIAKTHPQDRNGKTSYVAGRMLLDWDASSTLKFALNLNAWHDSSQPQAGQFIALFPQSPANVKAQELAYPFPDANPRSADWTSATAPQSSRTFYQAALRTDLKLTDAITVTSLTSYIDFKQSQIVDSDGSSLNVADIAVNNGTIRSFNQELRVANTNGSALHWIVGGNYENSKTFEIQDNTYADDSNSNPGFFNITRGATIETQKIVNYAVFGNTEYKVTPEFTLKAGLRYTQSKNNAGICGFDDGDGLINTLFDWLGGALTHAFSGGGNAHWLANAAAGGAPYNQRCYAETPAFTGGVLTGFQPSLAPTQGTLDEHNLSWTAGANYSIDSNALVYVNASRGYKAGSFPNLAASTTSQYAPARQETVLAFEGGVKLGLWDKKAQLNAAVFYYDYGNKQVLGKLQDPVFGTLDVLTNVPKSHIFGLEGDLSVRPTPGLALNAAVTYLDTKVTEYTGTDTLGQQTNFAGSALPFAPHWNYTFSADYRLNGKARGGPFVGFTVAGRSQSDTTPGGAGIVVPASPANRVLPGLVHPFTTNAYATLDARLGYGPEDESWKVLFWGKNVLNKYYWNNVRTGFDFTSRYAGLPATYGVTVSFKVR